MATQFEIDCALMAGRVYQDTRHSMNWLPVPRNWSEVEHVVKSSGFEASTFGNTSDITTSTEIVISFAGTGGDGDWSTNLSLYLGRVPVQLKEAADYYLSVKAATLYDTSDNTQSNANILRFGTGISASDVTLRLGSLMLDLGNGDEVHIGDFDQNDVFNSSSITSFEFEDSTVRMRWCIREAANDAGYAAQSAWRVAA